MSLFNLISIIFILLNNNNISLDNIKKRNKKLIKTVCLLSELKTLKLKIHSTIKKKPIN